MNRNYLLVCLLACIVTDSAARESIIGGQKAEVDQFRYQVALRLDGSCTCGGGIIDDRHILTAAHCVLTEHGNFRFSRMTILAATNNLLKTDSPAVIVGIRKIFVPAEFNPTILNHTGDIAVLKLKHALDLHNNKHLHPLELPVDERVSYVNKTAMIAGFGWNVMELHENDEHGRNSDNYLRFVEADVIDNGQCQTNHVNQIITDYHICARTKQYKNISKDRGVCTGDSGGPLVHDKTVIGILSISPVGCSEKKNAAIYTRVSHYLSLIYFARHDLYHPGIRTLEFRH